MSTSDYVDVTIYPAGRIGAKDLDAEISERCGTLSERRRYGVLKLKESAKITQAGILAELQSLQLQGFATDIKTCWAPNVIHVRLTSSGISKIRSLPNIERIEERAPVSRFDPDDLPVVDSATQESQAGVEKNLEFIGADSAWRLGITGKGRLVCIFDGADVGHPAIGKQWKGNDGDTSAAWAESRPWLWPVPYADFHGTHQMGIMLGHDDLTGDTIGVSPGARWIAAHDDLDGVPWIYDPDSDPNSTADVPDVVCISRLFGNCTQDYYQDLIDVSDALGIVFVFSAGNGGPYPSSVDGSAAVARDSLTNFAVGSVDHRDGSVRFSSSRGPSRCDGTSIKPNVTAPGVAIRSSAPGSIYVENGGTSMAVAHVAGVVALLRQAAPNATAREIKEAILAGCRPAGSSHPNNDYGWGIIDIPTSLEFLKSQGQKPYAIEIAKLQQRPGRQIDTLHLEVTWQNRGQGVTNAVIQMEDRQPGIRVLQSVQQLGNLASGEFAKSSATLVLDDTIQGGQLLPLAYRVFGEGIEIAAETLHITAGGLTHWRYFTHNTGKIQFSISNFGEYGLGKYASRNHGQVGFKYSGHWWNLMKEGALLVAQDSDHVSDGARKFAVVPDDDWWASTIDTMEVAEPGAFADQESFSTFEDGAAENSIGIRVHQHTFSWSAPPDDQYVILEFTVGNISPHARTRLYVGMLLNWMIDPYFQNDRGMATLRFNDASQTAYVHYTPWPFLAQPVVRLGCCVVSKQDVAGVRGIQRAIEGPNAGITDAEKFALMSCNQIDTLFEATTDDDLMYLMSVGPIDLKPGQVQTVAFAVLAADSLASLQEAAERARLRYRNAKGQVSLPERFVLHQNYPNPFNSETRIQLSIYLPTALRLDILNILGQHVSTVFEGNLPVGEYSFTWSASSQEGIDLASGVYFLRLRTGNYATTRKMLLLK